MDAAIKFPTSKTAPIAFPTTPVAVKASKLKLDKHMSIERAYQAIIRNCIAQIQANESGVVKYHDVECLHQMRVGLRRLRSAQAMFRERIAVPAEIASDIDWLASQLGPARDWDVLAGTTLAQIAQEAGQPALVEVHLAAQDKTHALHKIAAEAVTADRYSRLMLALTGWVERRGWRDGLDARQQGKLKKCIDHFAASVLAHDQRRLHKRAAMLVGAAPQARHRVRIAAKKTRYAAEFFGSLYAKKRVQPYVAALTALQDELGWMNDAAVAQDLLDSLGQEKAQLKEGVGFARGYLAARLQGGEQGLVKAWKRFAPLKVPR